MQRYGWRARFVSSLERFSPFRVRRFSLEAPKPVADPLHTPDSFLGLKLKNVEIDKEVFQQYNCYPTLSDVKFIKNMTTVLKGGAITWWEAAGILNRFDVKLQPFHVCEILKRNLDCDASMGLFRWAESQPGYKHDTNSYNVMLRVLGYNHSFRQLQTLVREMNSKNIPATYVTFMTVVQSYFDASMVDKALQTFVAFERYAKPRPKKKYYQYVLKRLIEFKRTDWIPTVVTGMLQVGHVTDTETFNVVIQGLSTAGRVSAALDLSREMVKKGCAPDVQTYIYLISGLVSSESMERVDDIIADMSAAGCKPNVHNFDLLLEFLLSSDKAEEALGVVKRMVLSDCCELHLSSNRIIMKFLERTGDAKLAYEFYDEIGKHEIYPDVVTYNGLLRLLNASGKNDEALELHERMRCGADVETKNIVMQILCKLERTEEAMEVFRSLRRLRLKPNKVTFDVLLVGLAVNDKLSDCLKVLRLMERNEFAPEETTYVCVIEALSIGGMHEQAFKLFGRMKLEGLSLSVKLHNDMLLRRRRSLEAQAKIKKKEKQA